MKQTWGKPSWEYPDILIQAKKKKKRWKKVISGKMVIYMVKHETAERKNQGLYKLEMFPPLKSIPGEKEKIKHYANQHKTHADLI